MEEGPARYARFCTGKLARASGSSKPVFAVAPYEADEGGVLRVVLPTRCPFAAGAESCAVYVDHHRARKTGPRFPLAVVGCSVHRESRFTLYPPGHVPYGRVAVVACSVTGPLLRAGETGEPLWGTTVFAAARDAARGERWPTDSPWDDGRRRRTQGQRLDRGARVVGVHPELGEDVRERIAARLGVALLVLRSAAQSWALSWTARGTAIVAVLAAVTVDGGLLPDRVLAAGAVTGLWAAPRRWDPVRRTWVGGRSEESESAWAHRRRGRDPPPTNSPAARKAGPD